MKFQLLIVCLLTGANVYTMDDKNKDHLHKALAYAGQKKDNEIVLFYYAATHTHESIHGEDQRLGMLRQELQEKLKAYCAENSTATLVDNLVEDISAVNGKTTIYMMGAFKLPVNHNDADLWYLKHRIDKLKEQQKQTPFIIAIPEEGGENLRGYLNRQYPDNLLISFPEKDSNFFTQPFVIVSGVVGLLGFFYFCFRMGILK